MSWLKWLLLIYAILAVKLSLGPYVSARNLPDAMLVLAILAMASIQHPLGFAAAAGIGFLSDLFWGERLGLSMLAILLIGYFLGGIRQRFARETPLQSIAVAWFLAGSVLLAKSAIVWCFTRGPLDTESAVYQCALAGLWCGLSVYILHLVLDYSSSRLRALFAAGSA